MFYSEVFLFLQACARHEVDTIIESGVKFGMSTALIRAGFSGQMISIEKDAAVLMEPAVKGVRFIHGDSRKEVPPLLNRRPSRRVGLLIDGPKGAAALALKRDAMRFANVAVVGVHDIARGAADVSCHSHDEAFRQAFGRRLDALIQHEYVRKYPDGPGLAIWENPL